MKSINVLLTDDHQIIIDGLKSLLEKVEDINVVGEAQNGRIALDLLKIIKVDVVLMDIDMPILNGIEATKIIKAQYPEIKVVVLSMHNESSLIRTLISAGANGYVLKNTDQEDLISAIRKVYGGQKYFSPDATISLAEHDALSPSTIQKDWYLEDLTDREIEILKLIAEGFSNKEIGEKLFISHRTVDTHRTNLMKKIGVKNIAGIIKYAIKKGFIS
ncbi:MAG: response regulator transcription factor [Bacteroidales bacterium]|nr:response regulator transcription factor [Bacteroidales bacterium]